MPLSNPPVPRTLTRSAAFSLPSLLAGIVILVALGLSSVAAGPGVVPGDLAITHLIQRLPAGSVGEVARAMNLLGETPVMLALGIVTALGLLRARRADAALLVVAAMLARAANPVLKALFASPRPSADQVRVDELASGWGFPSGHVMGMTLFVGVLAYLAWERWTGRVHRRMVCAGAATILLMSGMGRIYAGAHWPSDVLGGYLWGGIVVGGLVWSWRRRAERVAMAHRLWRPVMATDAVLAGLTFGRKTFAAKGDVLMTISEIRRRRGAFALGGVAAVVLLIVVGVTSALAQTPTTGSTYTARIIAGTCADPAATTAYELNPPDLTRSDDDDRDDDNDDAPSGAVLGSTGAVPVAVSGNQLDVSLDTLLAQPHAIIISSNELVVACGEIGGQLRGSDDLIIGLPPVGDSGGAGIAFLDGDDDDEQVEVTVYLISWLDTLVPAAG